MGEITESKTAKLSRDENQRTQWNKAEITHRDENKLIRKLKELVLIRTTELAFSQT
jgi:hypothetical protein